ncbi:MAG: 50S ribosomal protein L18e [Candidatus Altiarchaeales archaeon]|nr:MAG: 50S ribosomal protein L18e [Candidatus Altiarchaeales archaeon]
MPRTHSYMDPNRLRLIEKLKKVGREQNAKIWKKVAEELSRGRRRRREVNLWKIDKYTKPNDIVVVPGKVLAYGNLSHSVTIAAFKFSEKAKEKILASNSKPITIEELLAKNPRGSNVKILC